MIIDTSALVAILLGEPEAEAMALAISRAAKKLISAFTALEAGIVMEARKGPAGGKAFKRFLEIAQIEVVPFNREQFEIALLAWKTYGKGRHPAGLNIGDCCSYALARYLKEPLLFKGRDFSQTDIPAVK